MYVLDRRDGKLLRANALVRMSWANGVDMKTGRPNLTPENSRLYDRPEDRLPRHARRAQLASGGL